MARAGANGGPPAVCVYAGSSPGADPAFAEAAAALGRTVAGRGLELVYGGGAVGLMGVVANAAMSAGGRVTGIIPRALEEREIGHREVTDLVVVETMHERKALMAQRSGCFVALPGGIGTPAPPSRMRCSTPSHGGAPATTTSGSTGWAAPRWNLASGRRMPEPASIDLRGALPVA